MAQKREEGLSKGKRGGRELRQEWGGAGKGEKGREGGGDEGGVGGREREREEGEGAKIASAPAEFIHNESPHRGAHSLAS